MLLAAIETPGHAPAHDAYAIADRLSNRQAVESPSRKNWGSSPFSRRLGRRNAKSRKPEGLQDLTARPSQIASLLSRPVLSLVRLGRYRFLDREPGYTANGSVTRKR